MGVSYKRTSQWLSWILEGFSLMLRVDKAAETLKLIQLAKAIHLCE